MAVRVALGDLALAALLLGVPAPAGALAGDEAHRLIAPPHQILEAMLVYAEHGELRKVERSLDYVQPLTAELQQHFGVDLEGGIREAVRQGDSWGVQAAVLRMTYYWMKHELLALLEPPGSRESRVVGLRLAYLDFLLLEPHLEKRAPGVAAGTRRRFREIHELIGSRRRELDPGTMRQVAQQIRALEEECLSVFPGWRTS